MEKDEKQQNINGLLPLMIKGLDIETLANTLYEKWSTVINDQRIMPKDLFTLAIQDIVRLDKSQKNIKMPEINNNNVYVTKKFIGNESFSEIDLDLQKEFDFDYEKQDDFEIIEDGIGNVDAYPINIDELINTLNELKTKGASHVQLDYHQDHIGYDIDGFKLYSSTKEEIESYEIKNIKQKEKEKRLNDLYTEISKIKNEK